MDITQFKCSLLTYSNYLLEFSCLHIHLLVSTVPYTVCMYVPTYSIEHSSKINTSIHNVFNSCMHLMFNFQFLHNVKGIV